MSDNVPWNHPSRKPYRFLVLLFASSLTFGSYFAYDSVGAMETSLMRLMGIGHDSIGAMYTMYSVAAILSVFIGGILIDRIGTRRASLLFSALVTLGAAGVAAADNVWGLYAGRFVFGWGSESLIVAQSAILARWFKGKELALAFGVALTLSRLGTLFSFNTEAMLAERLGTGPALWIAVLLCGLSLAGNLAYIYLDKRAERVLDMVEGGAGDRIVFSQVFSFKPSFWFVTMLCVTFYSAIFPFTALSTAFFHEKWGLPTSAGGTEGGFLGQVLTNYLHMFSTAPGTTSIIIFASMVFAPFAGTMVDRVGRRATLMMVGALLMIPSYLLLGFTMVNPVLPMLVLGAAFVLVPAAMWPSIPLIVEEGRVGTAYGLMTMLQNIGLALFPWLNGKLRVVTHGYEASMVMFSCLGLVGFVFAVLLFRSDRKAGGVLERGNALEAGGGREP